MRLYVIVTDCKLGITTSCTADELLQSECTSCQIKQDMSAYWTPQLYFMYDDGTVEAVPEIQGHITYYKYTPAYTSSGLKNPEAMPNGLRIVSGDTHRRNFTLAVPDPPMPWTGNDATQDALAQKAIGFNCMDYTPGKKPEDTLYRHFMPDKNFLDTNCPDGLRLEVLFPYCWNGKDLDSDDHKSHMAFPDANQNGGKCPDGYDTVLNQILFETIYPTNNYRDKSGYFALSNGDPTGYGYHGDLFVAWEDGVLQQATEQCGPVTGVGASGVVSDCPVFELNDESAQSNCKIPLAGNMKYDMSAPQKALPGNNPIQKGPEPATAGAGGGVADPHPTSIEPTIVPTLAYSEGSSAGFTDQLGNIYAQKKSSAVSSEAASTPAPAPETTPSVVASAEPSEPAQPAAEAYTPAAAPVADTPEVSSAAGALPAVTTIYTTSGQAVIEKVIVQTDVTVTAGSAENTPAPQKKRRHEHHLHAHQHAARHVHGRR